MSNIKAQFQQFDLIGSCHWHVTSIPSNWQVSYFIILSLGEQAALSVSGKDWLKSNFVSLGYWNRGWSKNMSPRGTKSEMETGLVGLNGVPN
jgi:hypothetical protein